MKTAAVLIFGVALLGISIGIYLLTEAQLDDLPLNPVAQMLQTERRNLEEIRDLTIYGLIVGAVLSVVSGLIVAARLIRNR